MSAVKKLQSISVEDYLAGELVSSIKHEYVGGYVYAMAGARNSHNLIATNLTVAIGSRLLGKRCMTFNSDTKIHIPAPPRERFYYPDASIVCQPNSSEDSYQDRPAVIFEVLSDSTRRTDLGEKKDAYFQLRSLRVYALVEQDSAHVIVYRWHGEVFAREDYEGLNAEIPLPEVEVTLPLADIYARVDFTAESSQHEES